MAGRYQGYHIIPEAEGQVSFEVVWQNSGWFWRPPNGDAVGPFTTSSQAYQSAVGGYGAVPRSQRPGASNCSNGGDPTGRCWSDQGDRSRAGDI